MTGVWVLTCVLVVVKKRCRSERKGTATLPLIKQSLAVGLRTDHVDLQNYGTDRGSRCFHQPKEFWNLHIRYSPYNFQAWETQSQLARVKNQTSIREAYQCIRQLRRCK